MGTDQSLLRPTGPAWRQYREDALGRVESALWLLVFLTFVADLLTTYYGLEQGLAESNPFARSALDALGYPGLAVLKTVALTVAVCCRSLIPHRYGSLVPGTMGTIWGLAVALNLASLAAA